MTTLVHRGRMASQYRDGLRMAVRIVPAPEVLNSQLVAPRTLSRLTNFVGERGSSHPLSYDTGRVRPTCVANTDYSCNYLDSDVCRVERYRRCFQVIQYRFSILLSHQEARYKHK